MLVDETADFGKRFLRFRRAVVAQVVGVQLAFIHLQRRLQARLAQFAVHTHSVAEQQIARTHRQDGR